MGILVPEVGSYLEGFMCEVPWQNLCSSGEISENLYWKFESLVTTFHKQYK